MADTIGSNIRVAGNMLLHSFRTAAPCWASIALVAVILIIHALAGKKKGKKQEESYGMEGMCLGMCFGATIGTVFANNTGIGISFGMLIGLAVGMCFHKKPDDTDQ